MSFLSIIIGKMTTSAILYLLLPSPWILTNSGIQNCRRQLIKMANWNSRLIWRNWRSAICHCILNFEHPRRHLKTEGSDYWNSDDLNRNTMTWKYYKFYFLRWQSFWFSYCNLIIDTVSQQAFFGIHFVAQFTLIHYKKFMWCMQILLKINTFTM
jgi:hypothetical protein